MLRRLSLLFTTLVLFSTVSSRAWTDEEITEPQAWVQCSGFVRTSRLTQSYPNGQPGYELLAYAETLFTSVCPFFTLHNEGYIVGVANSNHSSQWLWGSTWSSGLSWVLPGTYTARAQ